ncbi:MULTISPECIES: branched-chain amino acid ABC transporter substrate-binding protein [Paraburkholderia]|jgi:branched-chain amino acid transport system substrate-binding protein|uniref:Branched-chain amino acid ABC transporter substrate-binding protein n=1 Tax=Paraburkholderia caribensis TaxID=75105 RepID=A0A9Q6S1Y0_9BURK|nr:MULTISPECIES: branched-chain amino acid ABC transporter substrate-binding protein [Paraburkholderia]ALP62636.1 branched chain amino acid ABC transporter substrate-binding protein [Paraburkholderia caribensis]AMV42998.1 branched chain amino acid ABC transporter substrate-binding protein [Paraburkholderia caribensis]AUT52135.1 branched-chain amino acid ABC transporter substrate-binding protein [Paraburkholderia caribensis]MCO4879524.1 branched-chain amino acid ABC transporter substrate-binding
MSFCKTLNPFAVMLGAVLSIAPLSSFAADELPVKIGFAAPMTGANAGYGKDLQNGVRLALEEANAQKIKIGDKVARFDLVSEDDQADPRIGVQAAQKLVDQNVSGIVGHFNSGTTIPASQIYEQAGIPMIDPAATNPTITNRGFANTFMVISTDAQNAGNAGTYAVKTTKAKRIAIIDDRTAFGQGEADEFEKAVKAAGGNIVAREFTSNTAVDFSTQLTKIKSTNADLIFFGGLDTQAAAIAKKMKQLGMTAQLLGGGGVEDPEFIKLAGDAAEGAMAWEYGRPLAQLPGGKDFSAKFKKRFGDDILSYAPFGYDAAWAVIKAMETAKSTDPKVYRAALKSINFEGVTGTISFDATGALKSAASTLYQVKNGVWVPVVTKSGV